MNIIINGKYPVTIGSTVFFGFRFKMSNTPDFDYDSFLLNQEDAENLYNCKIITIDVQNSDYAVTLADCHSFQINCAPQYLVSRKFNIRNIDDGDFENMQKFCEYFNIEYQEPAWRHATTMILLPDEVNKKTVKSLNDLERNF